MKKAQWVALWRLASPMLMGSKKYSFMIINREQFGFEALKLTCSTFLVSMLKRQFIVLASNASKITTEILVTINKSISSCYLFSINIFMTLVLNLLLWYLHFMKLRLGDLVLDWQPCFIILMLKYIDRNRKFYSNTDWEYFIRNSCDRMCFGFLFFVFFYLGIQGN